MADFFAGHTPPRWYEEAGPDHDIVLSSKARLSRNLAGFAFPRSLTEEELVRVGQRVGAALGKNGLYGDFVRYDFESLTDTQAAVLCEEGRFRLREEFRRAALFVAGDGRLCVEVNSQDHLRLSSLRGGLNMRGAWTDVDRLDSALEDFLEYAVSLDLGYLTAEVDAAGCAFDISALLHLPGVSLSGRLEKISKIISDSGFTLDGLPAVKSCGAEFFLVSGFSRLGENESDVMKKFEEICISLVNYEREMRHLLFEKRGDFLEDQMCRAFGILERAKFLTYEEAVKLLSLLRMGYCVQGSLSASWDKLTALIFRAMPAHIRQRISPVPGESGESIAERENRERACFIHAELKKTSLG
ncbi:MAG: hypothetical protein LBC67_04685 [Spirochaetales bacterium]|jgi:protein arginine kinase|nr:hypothetical protein [Spirochaetales bacterium]